MEVRVSDEDVDRIAEAVVEKAMEDVDVRDIMIGSAMGKGAIPLYGRETRKELCSCCLIDPEGPNIPENRMCTTKGAIGTLSDREEREWCSEIKIVSDGRCARARAIREAARVCKEKHPDDTEAFFRCYIPAFSQITRESNPAAKERLTMAVATGTEKARGLGDPRTDVERVMAHHNVSREEAERWLSVYPVEKLLPERGTGSALLKGAK